VYQFRFPNYYELKEDWEAKENTNIDVLEKIEENYLSSFECTKAPMNVLDEIP
jgi:hypothetical protein